ncbi:hypothetical protein DV735_g2102, partial [Chaetothyriales sp. CBS 134920]
MAIRERLRRTFRSKKSASAEVDDGYPPRRKDLEYYKPHEIPKSKYKGKVDPEHRERLEAYSLGDAFENTRRRTSVAMSGTFSPGGTQALSAAQSRRSSWTSREPSSTSTAASHLTNVTSATDATSAGSIDDQVAGLASCGVPVERKLKESHDNDSTRIDTADDLSRTVTAIDKRTIPDAGLAKSTTVGKTGSDPESTLFSAEELERAMTRATLRPRRGTVIGDMEELKPQAPV